MQRFYPNPFRYRKLKNTINQTEIIEEVNQTLKPFLKDKFLQIHDYVDEFGNLKSEVKIIRILRQKVKTIYEILKSQSNIASKKLESLNNIDNYNQNLRYLELPVQPITDKRGYEVQLLSNEIIEDTLEEIDEGFSYIYDYCSKIFPESSDLWNEYALLNPNEFPFISHDYILESSYEIFDKIFDNLQKNSSNFFSWVISGDLNTRLLKIVKPRLEITKINYLFILLESLVSLTIFLFMVNYIVLTLKSLLNVKNRNVPVNKVKVFFSEIKKDLNFKKFRLQQKSRKINSKLMNFRNNIKYKIVKMVSNRSSL